MTFLENSSEQLSAAVEACSDDSLRSALEQQLQKMLDRNNGQERTDIKYIVLRDFVERMNTDSFELAYSDLSDPHKHAVITRLENESTSFGGPISHAFILKLSAELYGIKAIHDEEETLISVDFLKKTELEQLLQRENAHLYKDGK